MYNIYLFVLELLSSPPLSRVLKYRRKHPGCTTVFAVEHFHDARWRQHWIAFSGNGQGVGWQSEGEGPQGAQRQLSFTEKEFEAFLDSLGFWRSKHNPIYFLDARPCWIAISSHERRKWINLESPMIEQACNDGKPTPWSELLSKLEAFVEVAFAEDREDGQHKTSDVIS